VSRRLKILTLVWACACALVEAPSALAITHGGQGIWGPTNATTITYTMFILIGFFPFIIVVFSLIQAWLEHRKHARVDAAARRAQSPEWKGGW